MIVAATGHRPDKLGGWTKDVHKALCDFALRKLALERPSGVISGMALGWDHAVAVACVRLGIPFVAAIPFEGQESRWPKTAQNDYQKLLLCASSVHVVCTRQQVEDGGVVWAFRERNAWMIDNALGVLALWDGTRSGGTFDAIRYAQDGCRQIKNVWPEWSDYWESGKWLI